MNQIKVLSNGTTVYLYVTCELCSPLVCVGILKLQVRRLRIALMNGKNVTQKILLSVLQRDKHKYLRDTMALRDITASTFFIFYHSILSPELAGVPFKPSPAPCISPSKHLL